MSPQNSYPSMVKTFKMKQSEKSSGESHFSSKKISCIIENYEVSILLDDADRFIGIESIRVHKNFYDPRRLPTSLSRSAEEIVDEFFKEIEE